MRPGDPAEAAPLLECADLENVLDAFLDGELAPRETEEASLHLASCEPCRERAGAAERTRAALRACLRLAMGAPAPLSRAPGELRERLRQALAREARPFWRRALAPLPLGSLAAFTFCAALLLAAHGWTDPLVDESVRKHARDLPLEVRAEVGPESLAGWLAGRLDFDAAPPRFATSGVRLVGARLSHIQDHPAAYVRYDLPSHRLGLFILDDPDHRFVGATDLLRTGASPVRYANAGRFHVAVWRRDEIVYSLVSDLEETELAELVADAQRPRAR